MIDMGLYEILKASKLGAGAAPDMYTALFAQKIKGGGEAELSGVPPLTFTADGTPLLDYLISGNTIQSGTPTPDSPIFPQGCGELEISGAKAGQNKIPILSANTTTSIYLGEVQATRKIKKLVLTGEENFTARGGKQHTFGFSVTPSLNAPCFCSHYIDMSSSSQFDLVNGVYIRQTTFAYISDLNCDSVAAFKAFLASEYANGTPVIIFYALATEETGIVNEPLMKIGNYADTLSKAQAGVSIPTSNGSTTVNVDTTVKPSEVYIKYRT